MDQTADCVTCGTLIDWIECPTGSWWAHRQHPADGHDAHPANCPRCKNTGIDPEFSHPAEGPSYYSMGEPESLEPCIACQPVPVEVVA